MNIMILFSFIDSYIRTANLLSNDDNWKSKISIKEFSIIVGLALIIYIVLNQINQHEHYEFKLYNKIILIVLLTDVIVTLTYVFRYVINHSMDDLDAKLSGGT